MPNTLLSPDMIAAESLMHFQNELVLAKLVSREWEDKFGREGAKIGDSCRLRKAVNFDIRIGQNFTPQNIIEQETTLTLDQQVGVDFVTDSNEESLTIDRFSERYAKPAMRRLANKVDALLCALYKKVPTTVGTYDTAPSALSNFTDAKAKLDALGVPEDDRHFVLDPITQGATVSALSALFNSQGRIAKQYEKGKMGEALGAMFHMGQNVAAHTVGALGGTPLVNLASQTGATIDLDGWSNSITGVLKEGDIITFASVNAVNPLTGEDLGFLREFTVLADVDSDGSGVTNDVPIDPPITTSGPYKTCTASPANNAVVLIFGHATNKAGLVARQPLYFHRDWATLAIAPQSIPGGTHRAAMKSDPDGGGIGIRYVCDYDIDTNQYKHRYDVLVGVLAQNPHFALRVMTT
jgi:hypothetical protein